MVGVVDIIGASDDAVLVVHHMLEGGEAKAIVFVACAENNIFGHREVGLATALTLGVVFGDKMLQLVATLEVVVEVVAGLVHHGVDALDGAMKAVVLQVVAALGRGCHCYGHRDCGCEYVSDLHFLFLNFHN